MAKLTETVPGVLRVRLRVSPDGEYIAFNRDYFNSGEDETTWIYVLRFDRPVADLMKNWEK